MQRVQRKFGTFLKRSDDEQDVGTLLHEFERTDKLLSSLISSSKAWRDAWDEVVRTQLSTSESFHLLYHPITTSDNERAPPSESVPQRTSDLEAIYAELKEILSTEISSIEGRLIKPAMEAKDGLVTMKKVLKKREDCKLDYERFHSRVENARKKEAKSAKDEASLAKIESDYAKATQDYHAADDQLRRALPPLLNAVLSLLPHLLATQIMLQYNIVAQTYTSVHHYCGQHGFPTEAPDFDHVVATWDAKFTPLRHEVESGLVVIANGKTVHQPMEGQDPKGSSLTGLGLRNNFAQRRKSSQGSSPGFGGFSMPSMPSMPRLGSNKSAVEEEEAAPQKPPRPHADAEPPTPPWSTRPGSGAASPGAKSRIPSSSRFSPGNSKPSTPFEGLQAAGSQALGSHFQRSSSSTSHLPPAVTNYAATYAVNHATNHVPNHATSQANDYFGQERTAWATSAASGTSGAAGVAAKKKPPPPPPKKKPSFQNQYVTALYDFEGQNDGDLSFREGERIRVIKKTESMNDWWEGEAMGVKGSFPANYVQA